MFPIILFVLLGRVNVYWRCDADKNIVIKCLEQNHIAYLICQETEPGVAGIYS